MKYLCARHRLDTLNAAWFELKAPEMVASVRHEGLSLPSIPVVALH
jgi:hypothetical protein